MEELERDDLGAAPARVFALSRTKLDVPGASGIVALSGGRFVIAHDDKGVYEVSAEGEAERVLSTKRHKDLKDLEGLCRAPEGAALFALSERTGRVVRVALDEEGRVSSAAPTRVGKLPEIGEARNKGWEGLDLLPAGALGDETPRIVAVHEGFPRKIGVFRLPDLEQEALFDLPAAVEERALDLADVAVEPQSSRVFLLSDESATLVELELSRDPWALAPIAVHHLDLSRSEKAESLDFCASSPGSLWMATDGKARLYELRVERN